MAGKSNIEWTDTVWNPVTGCTRVSAGCDHCYAFELHDKRYKANRDAARDWGTENIVEKYDDSALLTFARDAKVLPLPAQYDVPFSRVQLLPERLDEPLHWRKPRRVFVNSMGDLFHPDVPDEYIHRVFAVMALTPQHTYQILTKRPERMRAYMGRTAAHDGVSTEARIGLALLDMPVRPNRWTWPLPNVWLGVSVEDQAAADERIPHLLATPAAVRFLSCEPLLGRVVLTLLDCWRAADGLDGESWEQEPVLPGHMRGLDWVIVGGESGAHARPCNIDWIRDIVGQCRAAEVPVFVKQLGGRPVSWYAENSNEAEFAHPIKLKSRHGSDPSEWPEDLRIREMPGR